MAGYVLSVILVTCLVGPDVGPGPVREIEVLVVEGEVLSHGADILVLLDDAGKRRTFDLARATEAPEPLASGARVRVEFEEGAVPPRALVVFLVPEGCSLCSS